MSHRQKNLRPWVLVTGASGFLGAEVIQQLLMEDFFVIGLSRNQPSQKLQSFIHDQDKKDHFLFCAVDLTQPFPTRHWAHLQSTLQRHNILSVEAVIHTAAKAGVWGAYQDYYNINYQGTINLLDMMNHFQIKNLIYTSTPSVVFASSDIKNGDEALPYPTRFLTHYAATKAKTEQMLLNLSHTTATNVISLRPHLIWGPGDPHILPRLLLAWKQKRLKQVGSGENLVDVIHVSSAAYAHILALKKLLSLKNLNQKYSEAFFIAQERPVKLWDFIGQLLQTQLGTYPKFSTLPTSVAYIIGFLCEWLYRLLAIPGEPPMTRFVALQLGKYHYFSHRKAQVELGYQPKLTIEQGLEQFSYTEY